MIDSFDRLGNPRLGYRLATSPTVDIVG